MRKRRGDDTGAGGGVWLEELKLLTLNFLAPVCFSVEEAVNLATVAQLMKG